MPDNGIRTMCKSQANPCFPTIFSFIDLFLENDKPCTAPRPTSIAPIRMFRRKEVASTVAGLTNEGEV